MRPPRMLHLPCALGLLLGAASGQVQIQPLMELAGQTSEPSLSPDGKTIAFNWCKPDYSCGIYTRPLAGGTVQLFAEQNAVMGFANSPRWSPDGRTIALTRFYSHYDVHLVVRGFAAEAELDLGGVCWGQATWSPDGRFVVASRQEKTLATLRIFDG